GDALLLALARAGVGHAAVLRDAGIRTRTVGLPETAVDVDESALDLLDEAGSPGTASKAPAGEPPAAPEAALARLGAGDVELALRYLSDIAVIVVTEPLDAGASSAVAAGAAFAGAQLVAVVEPGQAVPEAFEGGSVFEMPGGDAGPAFASFVAAYAAALDRGDPPATAFDEARSSSGWHSVTSEA
ncbi:MAG TPA: hypothetical protein VIV06_11135, partial [Candidatus Limnocylindrales bacterium]